MTVTKKSSQGTTLPFLKLCAVLLIANLCFLNIFTEGFSNNLIHTSHVRHNTVWLASKHQRTRSPNYSYKRMSKASTSLYSSMKEKQNESESKPHRNAMDIYVDYVTRLWNETNTDSRQRMANQKAYHAVKHVQHLLQEGEEYVDIMNHHDGDTLDDIENKAIAKHELLQACNNMLDVLGPIEKHANIIAGEDETRNGDTTNLIVKDQLNGSVLTQTSNGAKHTNSDTKAITPSKDGKAPKKKQSRSVLFGASMGAIVACWVFSGNFLFTSLFTAMTILGQLEYYRMVMRVGIYPARKISVVGACAMFVTVSLLYEDKHEIMCCFDFVSKKPYTSP